MQDNQGNYCDLDIIQTPSATSLTSTRINSQTRLKRVCFNNTDYTLVDKPQKDGLVHILKDNKKRTSTDTSWSKSVNSEAITSHNRKKASNVRKPSKLISTSNERLLNDSHETDVDTLNSSDIFAQYK
uniref:Polymorphic transmembrane cluster 2 transmembrane protein 6 n=1 Tax=Biomphalaria glabrata TaxID=6526 RepID=A0A7G8ZAX8_BIOGL|nr:polymorphic transmembrane cluster 2 transmembrane protein 6 [Biomphalaria glabrata]